MTGQWVIAQHQCNKPFLFQPSGLVRGTPGDVWRCAECGKHWRVTAQYSWEAVVGDVPEAPPEGARATPAEQWKEQAERERVRANGLQERLMAVEFIVELMQRALAGVPQR